MTDKRRLVLKAERCARGVIQREWVASMLWGGLQDPTQGRRGRDRRSSFAGLLGRLREEGILVERAASGVYRITGVELGQAQEASLTGGGRHG